MGTKIVDKIKSVIPVDKTVSFRTFVALIIGVLSIIWTTFFVYKGIELETAIWITIISVILLLTEWFNIPANIKMLLVSSILGKIQSSTRLSDKAKSIVEALIMIAVSEWDKLNTPTTNIEKLLIEDKEEESKEVVE